MRIPDESLDDFTFPADLKTPEPPALRRVRPSGRIETVQPLARYEPVIKTRAARFAPAGERARGSEPHRISWFHQSLAIGGAIALIGFFLVTGLYIGIGERPIVPAEGQADLADSRQPAGISIPAEVPAGSHMMEPTDTLAASEERSVTRRVARRRNYAARRSVASYRVRLRRPPPPQFVMSEFIPTTLVIYPENGEIKSRIEPWLVAGYRKPILFPN